MRSLGPRTNGITALNPHTRHPYPQPQHGRRGGNASRRFPFRFSWRKAMFVLPNLFTVSSIFCGFYAIILATGEPTAHQLYQATLAVFFGLFFDGADGRVARLTRTQSDFGVQLDSLADVITFGAAPAVIVYRWGLETLGVLGLFVGFTFVACGALRLARFNVLATRSPGCSKYFVGLPIPLAAGVLISLVMFHQKTFSHPAVRQANIMLLVLLLSYLMVSNVPYRSFKDVRPSPKVFGVFILCTALFVSLALYQKPTFALLTFFCGYILMGLLEAVFALYKKCFHPTTH
jgi:CDP-diacylglycerol--serine O-phosphatidyltransferase